ncbi:hypothetical protein F5141DRAFT_1149514 [Pisolithus sp. B1]|nr:hypothetical protein F5141DRAFT_1149514 [Pisolithus sp. B1]
MFHFTAASIASSGKSPLINALCGMNDNNRANATPASVNETTSEIPRYVDTAHGEQFPWFDVPGSSTLMTPYWQHFNSQGLYVFNCVIVFFNDCFTVMDQAVLASLRE